uniref:DUF2421 domain-containing protein n=1 Tax=Eutreptiella gymnastica TaxID=73025 RepID=A0A6T1XVR9_9EUGL
MAILSTAVLYPPLIRLLDGKGSWAIITGVVMSERTVGLVFQKGVYRVVGTVVGCLAVLLSLYLLDLVALVLGEDSEVCVLVALVAVVSGAVYHGKTQRLFAKYDYAFFVTALTYDYLLLHSFQYHRTSHLNMYEEAHVTWYRILSICYAVAVVMLVHVFVFPDYAGDYLLQALPERMLKTAHCIEQTIDHWLEGARLATPLQLHQAPPGLDGDPVWDTLMASVGTASLTGRSAEAAAAKAAAAEPRLLNAVLHPFWFAPRKAVASMVLPMRLDWGLCVQLCMTLRHVDMLSYAMNEEMRTRLHDHATGPTEDLRRKLRAIAHVVGRVLGAMAEGLRACAFDGVLLRRIHTDTEEARKLAAAVLKHTSKTPGAGLSLAMTEEAGLSAFVFFVCSIVDAIDSLYAGLRRLAAGGFFEWDAEEVWLRPWEGQWLHPSNDSFRSYSALVRIGEALSDSFDRPPSLLLSASVP